MYVFEKKKKMGRHILGLDVISFSISMSLLFFCVLVFNKKKKKIGGEDAELYFFF